MIALWLHPVKARAGHHHEIGLGLDREAETDIQRAHEVVIGSDDARRKVITVGQIIGVAVEEQTSDQEMSIVAQTPNRAITKKMIVGAEAAETVVTIQIETGDSYCIH